MQEILNRLGRAGDIGSTASQGLSQCSHLEREHFFEAKMLDRSATMSAHHARTVGVVHIEVCPVRSGQVRELEEGSKIAVHAEDPVGHDERASAFPPV